MCNRVGIVNATPNFRKIENSGRQRSHKFDRIGVGRIRSIKFFGYDFASDPDVSDLVKTEPSSIYSMANEYNNLVFIYHMRRNHKWHPLLCSRFLWFDFHRTVPLITTRTPISLLIFHR